MTSGSRTAGSPRSAAGPRASSDRVIDADGHDRRPGLRRPATPTTTPRSAGTRGARSPAGTASRRSCSATAASASRRCKPDFRERSMLTMTRTEAIPYESMRQGMPLGLGDDPRVPRLARPRAEGRERHPVHADGVADDLRDGPRGGQDPPGDRRRSARRCSACCTRAWTPACAASRSSASARTPCRPTSTARRWSPTRWSTRTSSPWPRCCAERDEGFIQITQADGRHQARPTRSSSSSPRSPSGPVLHNVVAASPQQPRRPPQAAALARAVPGQGPADLRPVRHRPRRLRVHPRALEPLRRLARRGGRSPPARKAEKLAKMQRPGAARGARRRGRGGRQAAAGDPGRRRRRPGAASSSRASTASRTSQQYVGRSVGEIAEDEGKHPIEVMLDLSLAGDLNVEFLGPDRGSNAEFMAEMMSSPYTIPGVSDGGAHTKFFTGGACTTDFLTWLVRDEGVITLEEAHYRLSAPGRPRRRVPATVACCARARRPTWSSTTWRSSPSTRRGSATSSTTCPAASGAGCSGPRATSRSSSTAR